MSWNESECKVQMWSIRGGEKKIDINNRSSLVSWWFLYGLTLRTIHFEWNRFSFFYASIFGHYLLLAIPFAEQFTSRMFNVYQAIHFRRQRPNKWHVFGFIRLFIFLSFSLVSFKWTHSHGIWLTNMLLKYTLSTKNFKTHLQFFVFISILYPNIFFSLIFFQSHHHTDSIIIYGRSMVILLKKKIKIFLKMSRSLFV